MIKSYWLRLFLFALGGATIALVASMLAPKKYEAIIQIQIDQKPLSGSMPVSNAEQSVSDLVDFSRPRSLSTQVEQLISYGTINDAVREVARQRLWKDPLEPGNTDTRLNPQDIRDGLAVEADAASDLLSLRLRLPDMQLAKDVLAEIYVAFNKRNLESAAALARRAETAIQSQFDEIEKELKKVDADTEELRAQYGTPDLATQIQSEIQNLASIKQARDTARLDLATLTVRLESLESQLKTLKLNQSGGSNTAMNPVWQRLKNDQSALEAEYKGQLERYLPDRDEVRAIKAKLDSINAELAKEKQYTNATDATVPNQARQAVISQIEEGKANVRGLQDRIREASGAISEKEAYLKKLPVAQKRLSELNRKQFALEKLYQSYADRLKTLKAAQTGRITTTLDTTPAQPSNGGQAVSPKPVINTLFGIVAGLILGVLSMLSAEAKRQPIRSLAQLNQLAFRPVYRLVPELRAPYRGLSKAPPESYETLLANHLRSTNRPYRIAVVGLAKDAGASTTAMNLAVAGARHGSRVLLIECDPRGGLARLAGKQPAQNEVVEISPMIRGMATETLLTLGGERNPEVAPSVQQHEADLTIVDLEPADRSAEYAFVAAHVDEVILLVRAGRTKSVEFLQAQQALKEAGCPQVTVAFTRSSDLAVVTESADPSMVEDQGRTPKSLDA